MSRRAEPPEHNRLLDAELSPTDVARSEANLSVDALLTSAGGFGKAQMLTTAVALFAWVVHGAQVMSMAFVAPAAAIEFAEEATAVRMTGSFFFLGWLLGLALWGRLASQRGWLVALCCIEICVAISGCATAAATSGHSYLATRFLCGFAEGGVPTTSYGWAGEFLLPQHKPRAGIVLQVGFLIGSLCVTIGAYKGGAGQWRTLSAVISLAALPVAILCAFAPESPRWLRRAGYTSRASQVLRQIASLNGSRLPPAMIPVEIEMTPAAKPSSPQQPSTGGTDDEMNGEGNTSEDGAPSASEPMISRRETFYNMRPQKPLLDAAEVEESNTNGGNNGSSPRSPPSLLSLLAVDSALRRIVGILCFQWFVYSALFFGLSLHEAHNLRGALLNNSFQIPLVIITAFSFDKFGRRSTMAALLCAASLSCAAMAFAAVVDAGQDLDATSLDDHTLAAEARVAVSKKARSSLPSMHEMLSTIGVACMSAAFAGGYILSSELLPTDVRAVGLALCSQCSRVGGFFSPWALLIQNPAVPYALWAAIALAGGLSALLLPETLGEASLESIDDLHALMARRASRASSV